MISIEVNNVKISFEEESLRFILYQEGTAWEWMESYRPHFEYEGGNLEFKDAVSVSHERVDNGLGEGIRSRYQGFVVGGTKVPYTFETYVWIERTTGHIYFEWIPVCEEGLQVKRVYWPGAMAFEEKRKDWYTLLNYQQGLLIPNTWETELGPIVFDGFFGTAGAYMPWFGQIKEGEGCLALCTTPWNAGYQAEHPAGGPYTHVNVYFEPSLGRMEYRRVMRYTLMSHCDYNDMCKVYRTYVNEQGNLRTLREKAAKVPVIDRLIGSGFVHTGIKTQVCENSDFFDPEQPDKNNHLTTFAAREAQMREIHEAGAKKVYLHLDGWAQPGYDNQHPDYTPACEEAGGWAGMKSLADTMHELGYLFGIHDQYRDFYLSSQSFDEDYACRLMDGTIPRHQRWAGGPQSYLCGTQAPYYVKRNFEVLRENQIELDCAYLDVFTCNEGDECNNPRHRMSRRECYEARNHCFDYLMSRGILPSSEEVNDWCVPSMVFCHYAPYDFMLRKPGSPKFGVPVPLFNLVFHDCLIEPWMMDQVSEDEDYMLYAVLNGGAPYLLRDGAYPNFDGSFETMGLGLKEDIKRCDVVCELHEKVAKCEMVRHELVDGEYTVQRTVFADGTSVTVDFGKQTYEIAYGTDK
ncbi:DUF5696 domain-containing protein [Lachnospiraceae bacterium 48-21]